MDHERAGVDVADGIDEAHHASGAAQVEPRQRLAEGREMEERIAGEHVGAAHDPVVEVALLGLGGMQVVPGFGATTGRAQAGDAQLGPVSSRRWL